MRPLRLSVTIGALLLATSLVLHAQQEAPLGPAELLRTPALPSAGEDFGTSALLEPEGQAPGGDVIAVVRFTCPEHWYIYTDSLSLTLVLPEGNASPVEEGQLLLPQGKSKYDEFLEKDVAYLDGQFDVRLVLHVLGEAAEGEHAIGLRVGYQGCKPNLCYPPRERDLEVQLSVLAAGVVPIEVAPPPVASGTPGYGEEFAERSLIVAVAIAFLAGLALSLTPCVYPLIPITIGVIGATTDRRLAALARSLVYVLGISITYAALGLVAASAGEAFGSLLQSPVLYLALAAIFVALAASMFGLFTIEVPASWMSRLQAKVHGRWGLLGILVLGLLSGIAVTSCTAPVVSGALFYVFKSRNMVAGFLILFAIAWGMGTPLVVLGTFSGLVKALPKSGHWQQVVKYVFGVVLLVGAGYFVLRSGVVRLERPLPGTWLTSEAEALQQAGEQGKPVMLYFWQERCPACNELKAWTFPDEQVLAEEDRFVCARVDGTRWSPDERKRMQDEYGVWGFPVIAFIGSDGETLHGLRIEGYVAPEVLIKAMQSVP